MLGGITSTMSRASCKLFFSFLVSYVPPWSIAVSVSIRIAIVAMVVMVVFPTSVVMSFMMVMIVVVVMIVVNSWTPPVRAVTIWWIVVDPDIHPRRTIIVVIVTFNHRWRTITSIIHCTGWSIAGTSWRKYR